MKRRVLLLILLPLMAAAATYSLLNLLLFNAHNMGPGRVERVTRMHCAFRVLYYDPLSVEHSNETLLHILEDIVVEHGGCIEAYIGSKAGLKPLLNLTSYDIVVIRAHGGMWDGKGFYIATGLPARGPYDISEALLRRLYEAGAVEAGSPAVLTGDVILASRSYIVAGAGLFAQASIKRNSIFIVESCDSGVDLHFIESVLEKGAAVYIGWSGRVTPRDIDATLPRLLELAIRYRASSCSLAKILAEKLIVARDTGAYLVGFCRRG